MSDYIVSKSEQDEIDHEYELYFQQIGECKTKEDLLITFGTHTARLNAIKKSYLEYQKEAIDHGIEVNFQTEEEYEYES